MLDLAQNSLSAGAANIAVFLWADRKADTLTLRIKDDGKSFDYSTSEVRRVLGPDISLQGAGVLQCLKELIRKEILVLD